MTFFALLGTWIAVGLTLFMFSFLYKDNPFYKAGEHLYVGITIGYSIIKLVYDTWIPNVWRVVHPEAGVWFENKDWWLLIFPVLLGFMILTRFIPKIAWVSRWTFAFVVGYGSGLAIPATWATSIQNQAKGTAAPLVTRIKSEADTEAAAVAAEKKAADLAASSPNTDDARAAAADAEALRAIANAEKAKRKALEGANAKEVAAEKAATDLRTAADAADRASPGSEEARQADMRADEAEAAATAAEISAWSAKSRTDYTALTAFRDFTTIVLFLGVFSVLFYFFFSIEHKGPIKVASRVGVWFLMVYFGASYGSTVMGRLSLLYGRLTVLKDACRPQVGFAAPIILGLMIGVFIWRYKTGRDREESH